MAPWYNDDDKNIIINMKHFLSLSGGNYIFKINHLGIKI